MQLDTSGSAGVHGGSDENIGVWGVSDTNVGVRGESAGGRGGVFKGKKAQVRLVPSEATSHPTRGSSGDLFLDKHRRLWFCKSGTNWVMLA